MHVHRSVARRWLLISALLSGLLVPSCSTETMPTDSLEPPALTGGISGLVMGDGAPVSGVTVTLSRSRSQGATVVTDADGEFGFTDLETGTYTVAIAEISGMTCSRQQATSVRAGEETQVIFACVTPAAPVPVGRVEGRVTVNGFGAGRVLVSLSDAGGRTRTTLTGNDGFYRFTNVPTGAKSVSIITDDPCPGTRQENHRRGLDVMVSEETAVVADFACTGQVITGTVTVDGFSVSLVTVYVCYGVPVWDYGCAFPTQLTDSEGRYSYTSLRPSSLLPGEYVVFVRSQVDLTCPEPLAAPLSSGETVTVNLACVVTSPTGGIWGLVTADGAPVSGVRVTLSRSGSEVAAVVTDANGEFGFTDLETGIYTVAIAEISGMTCSSQQAAPVLPGEETQVKFACVTFPVGEPLEPYCNPNWYWDYC